MRGDEKKNSHLQNENGLMMAVEGDEKQAKRITIKLRN